MEKRYNIIENETNEVIWCHKTLPDAERCLAEQEELDKVGGYFDHGRYRIEGELVTVGPDGEIIETLNPKNLSLKQALKTSNSMLDTILVYNQNRIATIGQSMISENTAQMIAKQIEINNNALKISEDEQRIRRNRI